MKKLLFLAALSSVALASCVSDESPSIDATPSGKAISFNAPVMYSQTKAVAGEIGTTYDINEAFRVYAVWTPNTYTTWDDAANKHEWYMGTGTEGVKVTWNPGIDDDDPAVTTDGTGAWAPSPNYYWPKNGYLTFAAYSPADASGTFSYEKEGLTITNFEVEGTASNQYDLMFSDRAYNKKTSTGGSNTTYDGVDILFKHALSSIKFKVKLKDDYTGTTIKVKKISIYKIENKGTFTENISTENSAGDIKAPAWTPSGALVPDTDPYIPFSGEQVVTTTPSPLSGASDLILMPQKFHDGTTATNAEKNLKIEYTITSAAGNDIPQEEIVSFSEIPTDAGNVSEWKIGFRYTYTLIFGLDKIYFAPEVKDWVNVYPGDINI